MSRLTAAIVTASKLAKTDTPTVTPQRPANDAGASHDAVGPVPVYTVTPEAAAKLRREALALDAVSVKTLPRGFDEYVAWVERTQGRAWRDQQILAKIPLDGGPVTRAEIDALGVNVEWVRQVSAGEETSDVPSPAELAKLSTPQIAERIRGCHKLLHNGLMLRLKGSPEARKGLRGAAKGASKAKLSARSTLLLAHVATPGTEAALRALPCGEGAAIDSLKLLHPEWIARLKDDANEEGRNDVTLLERAVALIQPTLQRVLTAGRYLEKAMPERKGTYPGYRAPSKPRAKKRSTQKTDAQKTDAQKSDPR